MAEKLVDADFLSRLTQGSYETAMGAVDLAVQENVDLFGGPSKALTTLATYPEHLIVATDDGDFYRAKWKILENGSVEITDVEDLDVPVYEAAAMGHQVQEESSRIVGLILSDNLEEASESMGKLYNLVKQGVRLTAEGVEDLYNGQDFTEDDWFQATREQEKSMRSFLGGDALRIDTPKARFENLIDGDLDDEQAELHRGTVRAAIAKLREKFASMRSSLALAREVNETYQPRDGGDGTAVADFVEFVQGLAGALDEVGAILSDANVVAEDGCVKCIARVHDGIASQAYEWVLATAFSEKLARRFDPVAA